MWGILNSERLNSGLGLISLFVLDVALRVAVDGIEVFGRERAAQFAGLAHEQAAGGDDGAFRDQGTGGDNAAGPDSCAVEDDAAHADEAARFDGATVQDDGVAYGDVIAENERIRVAHDVEDGAVLDICVRADTHDVYIAAKDGAGPHAGMFPDDDIADDYGLRVDVGGCSDLRRVTLVRADHFDWSLGG